MEQELLLRRRDLEIVDYGRFQILQVQAITKTHQILEPMETLNTTRHWQALSQHNDERNDDDVFLIIYYLDEGYFVVNEWVIEIRWINELLKLRI